MITGLPKISVYIITYNQEDLIDRTLSSILNQIDYVYEICVSDDHSTDRTWEILQNYSEKYPGLFKLNRNEQNLGIFENTEKVWTMPTGDIVYDLAGDDCVGEGYFKKVIDFISDKHIDYKNELFCIYGDYKCIYPNGDYFVFTKNDEVLTGKDPFRLSLRMLICNRSACYSRRVLEKFKKVSQGRSYIAEGALEKQLQIYTEKSYYIPCTGNVYFTHVGVTTQLNSKEKEQNQEVEKYTLQVAREAGLEINKKDVVFCDFVAAMYLFHNNRSFSNFCKLVYLYISSYDSGYSMNKKRIKRLLFALVRRMPHSKPLQWII